MPPHVVSRAFCVFLGEKHGISLYKLGLIGRMERGGLGAWPRRKQSPLSAVPTDTSSKGANAARHTWRRDVAPLEGCHTYCPIDHALWRSWNRVRHQMNLVLFQRNILGRKSLPNPLVQIQISAPIIPLNPLTLSRMVITDMRPDVQSRACN